MKGFQNFISIYQADENLKPVTLVGDSDIVSVIKTHLFNINYEAPPDEKCQILPPDPFPKDINEKQKVEEEMRALSVKEKQDFTQLVEDCCYISGRTDEIDECFKKLKLTIKDLQKFYAIIIGHYGSGKSLFIRKIMKKYKDDNLYKSSKEYKNIFYSIQMQTTLCDLFNGFRKIFQEIRRKLKDNFKRKFILFIILILFTYF